MLSGGQLAAQSFAIPLDVSRAQRMNVTQDPAGTYAIQITGDDAFIPSAPFSPGPYDPERVYVISFEYLAPAGLDFFEIFYGATSATRRAVYTDLPKTSTYRTFKAYMKFDVANWNSPFQNFRFDFSRTGRYSLSIRNLQLRAPTPTEIIPLSLNLAEQQQMTTTENADGTVTITTTGGDPFIATEPIEVAYEPATTYVLSYNYVCPQGLDLFQTFFGSPWAATRRADFGPLPASSTKTSFVGAMTQGSNGIWTETGPVDKLRFDFGRLSGRTITVSDFYLREPTFSESKAFAPPPRVDTVDIELDVTFTSADLDATEAATGSYVLQTSGNDPWIRAKSVKENYDTDSTYILEFEYRAAEAYNELQLFYGPPITGTQSLTASDALVAAPEWTTRIINPRLVIDNFQANDWFEFRFDFGRGEGTEKTIEIRNITLRPPTPEELAAEQSSDKFVSRRINDAFLAYLDGSYGSAVTAVKVAGDAVRVSGQLNGSGPFYLAEVQPQEYGFNQDSFAYVQPLGTQGGSFTSSLDRYVPLEGRQYDRLYSRWAVVTPGPASGTYTLASPLGWATDIAEAADNNLPEDKAETIKGLDGLTPSTLSNFGDLVDLDIQSMKINLLLHGALSLEPTGLSHTFNGKEYFLNPNFIANLDSRVARCTESDIKVAFVLLIPLRLGNPDFQRIFVHPDANSGLYSMANVTSAEGVEYYTAMVDFLAQRYSRPDQQFGRMDQWIIHNEVDAHTDWTHAGQKPVELYTQIYDRSMRMVHFTIRKHNPTAKVFASFTKHWNSKAGSSENFRSRDVLAVLNRLTGLEGDYEWNIAWHSYPNNLFDPTVWNDPPAKTPLNYNAQEITPRNLEMIDAYVRQKSLLYNGKKVRTVLLSENGFSSNPERNPNATQTNQAAALAYFWKKADGRLPSIENIQLHRWVDNPNEAGLEFGLWTVVPGTIEGFNVKKEGWYVWEAAGTVEQEQIFDPYKSVIGISDWSEIQYQVTTEVTPYRVDLTVANCDASLEDIIVSFNGERKRPQPDGTIAFYNVASNVPQPYVIEKSGTQVASDTLFVTQDTAITIGLPVVTDLSAEATSPYAVEVSWTADFPATGFVIESRTEGGAFSEAARVGADDRSYLQEGLTAGTTYTYRVAAILSGGTLSCYGDEVTVTTPSFVVDYRNGDLDKPDNTKIVPILQLRNVSDAPAPVAGLSTRYWFTADDDTPLVVNLDESSPYAGGITASIVELDVPVDGADHYLELSFTLDTVLPAGGTLSDIRSITILTRQPVFDETNDYSYANVAQYVETTTVTLYRDGDLIWGEEPGEAAAGTASSAAAPTPLAVTKASAGTSTLFPNPAAGEVMLRWSEPIEAVVDLHLIDAAGRVRAVPQTVGGQSVLLDVRNLPVGLYVLHGRVNGQWVAERLSIAR